MSEQEKPPSIIHLPLDQIMAERFARYSKYIIQNRALPDARDGLKPVQRRILFAMHELKLTTNSPYKKAARVVGEVIGKYHPHGDSSIYEAMVRLAQEWKMGVPLVDMHGNKGSIDDDPAAAMRYTEVRLAAIAGELLAGIDKDTVNFAPNFDDTEREPVVLPGLMPNLLVNGARGIAAGYATEMPPHNLGEVIEAIIYKIRNPQARLQTLLNILPGPDFPTGGLVQGSQGIYQAFERGQGKIVIRGKWEVTSARGLNILTITEIPFGVIKQKLVRDIDEIRLDKAVDGIREVRDESDRNGIAVVVEFDKALDPPLLINYLLKKTELQITYHYNNIAIVDNAPRQLGLLGLIDAYLKHQKEVQTRGFAYDLQRARLRLEIVEGLMRVKDLATEIINVIRAAENSRQGVIAVLQQKFAFTPRQAEAIADLRLYRLSHTDQEAFAAEAVKLRDFIARLTELLSSEEVYSKYLIELLRELKRNYATPRKTVIEANIERVEVDREALVRDEAVLIGVSRHGYVKRLAPSDYALLNVYALKPDDMLAYYALGSAKDRLVIFTSAGRFITLATHQLASVKPTELGTYLAEHAPFATSERVVEVIAVTNFELNAFVTLLTSEGKIKRVKLAEFASAKNVRAGVAISLVANETLVAVRVSDGNMHLLVISTEGKATHYRENAVPVTGTKARGVIAINLPAKAQALSLVAAKPGDSIGLITAHGEAKRMRLTADSLTTRTTNGKLLFTSRSKGLHSLDARVVDEKTLALILPTDGKPLMLHDFANVAFSAPEHGFKPLGPAGQAAQIMLYTRLDEAWQASHAPLDPEARLDAIEARVAAAISLFDDQADAFEASLKTKPEKPKG